MKQYSREQDQIKHMKVFLKNNNNNNNNNNNGLLQSIQQSEVLHLQYLHYHLQYLRYKKKKKKKKKNDEKKKKIMMLYTSWGQITCEMSVTFRIWLWKDDDLKGRVLTALGSAGML